MIGAFISRGATVEKVEKSLQRDKRTVVKAGRQFIAWASNDLPHVSIASLPRTENPSETQIICGFFGILFFDSSLEAKLRPFLTDLQQPLSPALYLALAFRHLGRDSVATIEGEYSFFIYDLHGNSLISRTDNMGVQRFHYRVDRESYCLCTDFRSLLNITKPRTIRDKSLKDYFYLGYIPAPETIYLDTHKTTPNHFQIHQVTDWQTRDVKPHLIGDQSASSRFDNASPSDVEELFLFELRESINRHLDGATTASVLLTSGYDSSLCASILNERCDSVYSYTIGFLERPDNENDEAEKIAAHLGLQHLNLIFSADQMLDALVEWIQAHAEPWCHPNGLSTYLALGEVRKYTTDAAVFDGSGGDYLFRDFTPSAKRIALAFSVPKTPEFLQRFLFHLQKNFPSWRARQFLTEINLASARYAEDRLIYHNPWNMESYKKLLGSDFSIRDCRPGEKYFSAGPDALDRFLEYYRSWGFDASVGRAVIESNLQGIRATFPYEDSNLVRFVESIPDNLKFKTGSMRFLQENVARRFIPDSFFASRKKAMETPLELILNTSRGRDLVDHYLSQRSGDYNSPYSTEFVKFIKNEFDAGKKEHALKLWSILVFEIWDESRPH
jgi:asparagine synthase (glutamine-hydrolysing)